jgi:hypothetical protein
MVGNASTFHSDVATSGLVLVRKKDPYETLANFRTANICFLGLDVLTILNVLSSNTPMIWN